MKKKIAIIAAIVVVVLVLLSLCVEIFGWAKGDEVIIYIEGGTGPSEIYNILKEKNVISIKPLFALYARGDSGSLMSGEHTFFKHMPYGDILKELKTPGKAKVIKTVTIPEGYELREIADLFEKEDIVKADDFKKAAQKKYDYDFLPEKSENYLEGYLFPNTYSIVPDMTSEDIIVMMLEQFNSIFTEEYRNRAKELDMSIHEIVTLASIIEREAAVAEERELVSSVFHNRLKSDEFPLLQSCATVQYILEERKEVLTNADIAIDSPYNTYKYKGLPPGPIASPGEACIKAALYPADTNYYFFVSNGDGTQTFSETFAEHNRSGVNAQ